jgi:hypothetical protein
MPDNDDDTISLFDFSSDSPVESTSTKSSASTCESIATPSPIISRSLSLLSIATFELNPDHKIISQMIQISPKIFDDPIPMPSNKKQKTIIDSKQKSYHNWSMKYADDNIAAGKKLDLYEHMRDYYWGKNKNK